MLHKIPSLFPWKHNKTKIMAEPVLEEDVTLELELHPCGICGRTFLPSSLQKHSRICEKNATKKRKVFNSLKQRVEGTDLAPFHQKSFLKKEALGQKTSESTTAIPWKEKHQQLVTAIRAAKSATDCPSPTISKQRSTTVTHPGMERCPSCDRQFGPKAFDRHVEWCKERKARLPQAPANVSQAKERLDARIKYRVPPMNKPKRTVREKYQTPQRLDSNGSSSSLERKPSTIVQHRKSLNQSKHDKGSMVDVNRPPVTPLPNVTARSEKSTSDLMGTARRRSEMNTKTTSKRSSKTNTTPSTMKINTTQVNEQLTSLTVHNLNTPILAPKKLVGLGDVLPNGACGCHTAKPPPSNKKTSLPVIAPKAAQPPLQRSPSKGNDLLEACENIKLRNNKVVTKHDAPEPTPRQCKPTKKLKFIPPLKKVGRIAMSPSTMTPTPTTPGTGNSAKTPDSSADVKKAHTNPERVLNNVSPLKPFNKSMPIKPIVTTHHNRIDVRSAMSTKVSLENCNPRRLERKRSLSFSFTTRQKNITITRRKCASSSLAHSTPNILKASKFHLSPKVPQQQHQGIDNNAFSLSKKSYTSEDTASINDSKRLNNSFASEDDASTTTINHRSYKRSENEVFDFEMNLKPTEQVLDLSLVKQFEMFGDDFKLDNLTSSSPTKPINQPADQWPPKPINDQPVDTNEYLDQWPTKESDEPSEYMDQWSTKPIDQPVNVKEYVDQRQSKPIDQSVNVKDKWPSNSNDQPENMEYVDQWQSKPIDQPVRDKEYVDKLQPKPIEQPANVEYVDQLQPKPIDQPVKVKDSVDKWQSKSIEQPVNVEYVGQWSPKPIIAQPTSVKDYLDNWHSKPMDQGVNVKEYVDQWQSKPIDQPVNVREYVNQWETKPIEEPRKECVDKCPTKPVNQPVNVKEYMDRSDHGSGVESSVNSTIHDVLTMNAAVQTSFVFPPIIPDDDSIVPKLKNDKQFFLDYSNMDNKVIFEKRDVVNDVESAHGLFSHKYSSALSRARLERELRSCCSDVSLQQLHANECYGVSSSSETDLSKFKRLQEVMKASNAEETQLNTTVSVDSVKRHEEYGRMTALNQSDAPVVKRRKLDHNDGTFGMHMYKKCQLNNIQKIKRRKFYRSDQNKRKALEAFINTFITMPSPNVATIAATPTATVAVVNKEADSTHNNDSNNDGDAVDDDDDVDDGNDRKTVVEVDVKSSASTPSINSLSPRFVNLVDLILYDPWQKPMIQLTRQDCKNLLLFNPMELNKIDEKLNGSKEHNLKPLIKRSDNINHKSEVTPSTTSTSPDSYNPFLTAERQLMELLECDDFKPKSPLHKSTPKKPIKKQPSSTLNKTPTMLTTTKQKNVRNQIKNARVLVTHPPNDYRKAGSDDDDDDNFELIENFINDNFQNEDALKNFDFDSLSLHSGSIDPRLINECDNLSIPEHLTTTIHDDDDLIDRTTNNRSSDFSYGRSSSPHETKRSQHSHQKSTSKQQQQQQQHQHQRQQFIIEPIEKTPPPPMNREQQQYYYESQHSNSNLEMSASKEEEDLFPIDDEMYEEYKKYEQMYLQEREEKLRMMERKGISEDDSTGTKISGDSAYGSLSRTQRPKVRTKVAKLSPLEPRRTDSASSSGSEHQQAIVESKTKTNSSSKLSKFCHECGNKYPLATAKFCVECGVKRLVL